jgi:hypothetical protein
MTASCADPSLPAFVPPTAPTPPAAPADYPTISLVSGPAFPANGVVIGGTQSVDAVASDYPGGISSTVSGVSSTVQFEVTGIGNSLSNYVVGTAGPTLFGYLVSWNTSNVPDGTYWFYGVTCNTVGNCSNSQPIIITVDNPTTRVLVPSSNAISSGVETLDASASDPLSTIRTVQFEVNGNGLSNLIVPSTSTIFGYVGQWNTSGASDGAYTIESKACNMAGICATSAPISLTVDAGLSSAVVVPSTNAIVSGTQQVLSATAFDANDASAGMANTGINGLQFEITGGNLSNPVIVTASPYLFGWIAMWNTTTVPDGSYTLQSLATDTNGVTGASPGITVAVNN